ncbi:crossover junction endodeoxyribonuclease RuvC [Candidatus Roizmanbacteria bacterium RIFCSPLOWO2_01_FULL_35_13]|uniref:Crossover junction endodeoxyribonuclease RuvC n=1 Tax=Candidatus Roizmanbacteria bacterium RIFCSPLOWO2_01_FULL_35_13 TaxID=1802055 RepID=A0A1F7IHK3_9BACT|nr:MAG: crossover junction endodeoxyribonuclease RuvC [Candidatus Roizmanbacteria bacterium RIFCSPLOWO2_01_FULL_35_13]
MIILAIDSGLEKTGFAVFKKDKSSPVYIASGLIITDKKKKTERRVWEIYNRLNDVIKEYRPTLIVIEQLFFFKNQKTVISVAQTQGAILLLASQNNIPVEFLTPLQIKQTVTGYGLSDKESVRKMIGLTLKIDKKIKEDDEIDAIACGLAYCYLNKSQETTNKKQIVLI